MNIRFVVGGFVAALFGQLVIGCTKPGTLQNANAPSTPQMFRNLITQSKELANDGIAKGKETWTPADPLPPAIRSLAPQVVQLRTGNSPRTSVLDIQTSGGFQHRGYLVVCATEDPNFIPTKGRNWRIKKLAPELFEYQE